MNIVGYEIIDGRKCPRVSYYDMLRNYRGKSEVVIATNLSKEDGTKLVTVVNTCQYNKESAWRHYYNNKGIYCRFYHVNAELYGLELAMYDCR